MIFFKRILFVGLLFNCMYINIHAMRYDSIQKYGSPLVNYLLEQEAFEESCIIIDISNARVAQQWLDKILARFNVFTLKVQEICEQINESYNKYKPLLNYNQIICNSFRLNQYYQLIFEALKQISQRLYQNQQIIYQKNLLQNQEFFNQNIWYSNENINVLERIVCNFKLFEEEILLFQLQSVQNIVQTQNTQLNNIK